MTINTFEVANKHTGDNVISDLENKLRSIDIKDAKAFSTKFYTIDGEEVGEKKISELIHHNITEKVFCNLPLKTNQKWEFAIKIDSKPGVTDNAARVLRTDMKHIGLPDHDVYTSQILYINGEFNPDLKNQLERLTSNPQIHDITIMTRQEYEQNNGFDKIIHPVNLGNKSNYFYINLGEMDKDELLRTGTKGTLNLNFVTEGMSQQDKDELRGGTLSLKEDYMNAILKYTNSKLNTMGGNKKGILTDTELELLAQMWSEHCRHSLYNSEIPDSKKGIFNEYIKKPTEEILKKKPYLGVSIFKDNAGVFVFNDDWLVCVKNETHNSPSALDPYGGAITGIVGVNRDPAGTGLGAEVIGNFQFYRFGRLDDTRKHFKAKKGDDEKFILENLMLNPKQIFDGVINGVQDGGNQMGIPINIGDATYDDRYNGKPIVGVGSIGRIPHKINGLNSFEKQIDVDDRLYIIGGRAGKDGIHGATFSSEALSENSPATAVQIGDAYTQRKMFEAILELRDKGYIKYITDLGAGGVCCAAFEMAEETNGLEINLDNLLVKYPGMTATELLLNESQERMAIAVNETNKNDIEQILKKHEVEFSDIGIFTDSGRGIVYSKQSKVVDMDMNFIHTGMPKRSLQPKEYKLPPKTKLDFENKFNEILYDENSESIPTIKKRFNLMIQRPNFSSVANFTDKMDSTVKGLQVQHCIQGKGRVSTKTSCTLVDINSKEGLIQSYGHTERQSYIDSEKMGKNAFLRAIGNNVAMGGRLDYMIATDQALWQSSDRGEYQQMLIEANKGMASVIKGCEIPVISGKDSMYNQVKMYAEDGSITERGVYPELSMITFAKIDDVNKIVTIDAKEHENLVYVVGSITKNDLGGSEYLNMHSEENNIEFNIGNVSDEDITDVFDTFKKMNKAVDQRLLQSSIYIESGGLAMAVHNTVAAGELRLEFDLNNVHKEELLRNHELMYSETEGRFLVTIKQKNKKQFEELFKNKLSKIGIVNKIT